MLDNIFFANHDLCAPSKNEGDMRSQASAPNEVEAWGKASEGDRIQRCEHL